MDNSPRPRLLTGLVVRRVVWLCTACILIVALSACHQGKAQLFSTAFGVAIGDVPASAEQVDALGPVWYMDYHWSTPSLPGHERLYVIRCWEVPVDKGAIAAAMKASGSAWWSLGNEPNDPNQDNVSAEDYAELYHAFEGWAAGAPGCRIASAGIGNADWNWAEAFREAYQRKYGRYPRVDAWNIHNYILEPGLDPYDVGEFQRRILAFRRWMESIGNQGKILILSEFGVLYGSGCCGRPVDPPEKIQAFMRDAVLWLSESGSVDGWAWFATDAGPYNGSLLDREGELDELGWVYHDLVRQERGNKGK